MSDGDERGARTVRSYAFLVNPLSGGGAAPGAVVPVARILREAGARVDVTYSPVRASLAVSSRMRSTEAMSWSQSAGTACCRRSPGE